MNTIVVPLSAWMRKQQIDHGRLHRDVERRDGLVGDQQLRIAGESARNGDALLLAAGELARPAMPRRRRQLHHLEQPAHALLDVCAAAGEPELAQRAGDRPADRNATG